MQDQNIVIVDYGMGNLRSVLKKINTLQVNVSVSSDPKVIASAHKLILPGVGHFATAMKNLNDLGLIEVLNDFALVQQKPVLGICLGMQLMAKCSEEGNASGLGWFDAQVVKLKVNDTLRYKIPHTGWNSARINKKVPLLEMLSDSSMFYFVHAYCVKCNDIQDVMTFTDYEGDFVSAIHKNNIYGVQFHPEKSHEIGLKLLENFSKL